MDGEFLVVPHFILSVHKSTKQFGFGFAYDAPKVWNELPDDISSATSLFSFKKNLKDDLLTKAYPPQVLVFYCLCGMEPPPPPPPPPPPHFSMSLNY